MPRKSRVPPSRLAWYATILMVAGPAFMLVLGVSIAGAFRTARPAIALAWAPLDAGARAAAAGRLVMADRSAEGRNQAAALAIDAIRRDPTQVPAVRSLALAAGDSDHARVLMAHSQRLSRRDQLTQLWYIQRMLGRDPAVITHFDIALRTSSRNRNTIMPLLVLASGDPRLVAPLRGLLSDRPDWWLPFLRQLAETGQTPRAMVMLTRGMLDPDVAEQREVFEALLQRLIAMNEFDLAFAVYREASRSAAEPMLVRDSVFETFGAYPPFDWEFRREPDLWADRQAGAAGASGSALRVAAFNGRSGDAARQLIRLAPGQYRLAAVVGDLPERSFDRPAFRVACAGPGGGSLLDARPAGSGGVASRVSATFSVPAGCRWQWLSIFIAGQGPQSDTGPWIDNLTIARMS